MLSVGNVFLRTTQGIIVPVAGPTCTPFLSGLAIGPDFQMSFCDVTTDAEVIALSSAQSNNAANYWPQVVAGKRMASVQNVTLISDSAAANGMRYLQLLASGGSSDAGVGAWENLTIPFDQYANSDTWVRIVVSNYTDSGDSMDFVTPNYGHGLGLSGYAGSPVGAIGVDNFMGAAGSFASPILTGIATTDVLELILHVQTSNWVDQGTYYRVDTTWAAYARNHTTGASGSHTGITGTISCDKQNSDAAKTAPSPWILQVPGEYMSGGSTRVHAWEFVNGAAHVDPFGLGA